MSNFEIKQEEVQQYELTVEQATKITNDLPRLVEERKILETQYDEVKVMDIEDPKTSIIAKELRLKIRDNRTKGFEAWHKVNKEYFLRGGQFCDAIKKREIAENVRMEDALESIEKHFENIENEKREQLHKDRVEQIKPYVQDADKMDFKNMPEDVYQAFYESKKAQYEKAIKEEEEAKERKQLFEMRNVELLKYSLFIEEDDTFQLNEKTSPEQFVEYMKLLISRKDLKDEENKRIKERQERDQSRRIDLTKYIIFIRDFNAVLDMDEKTYQKELRSLALQLKEHLDLEELKEKQRLEEEAKRKAEAQESKRKQAEAEAKARQAEEEKNEAERKLKEKEDAEKKAKEDAELKEKQRLEEEARRGDKEKFEQLILDIENLKEKYVMKSERSQSVLNNVKTLFDKTVIYINQNQ